MSQGRKSPIPKPKHTEINLTLDRHGYHPGEKLSGSVELKVLSSTKFVNLRVEVYGVELTRFDRAMVSETSWLGGATYVEDLKEDFWYYRHVVTLDGHTLKSGEKWGLPLTEGDHEYAFSIDLPSDLPPTFHGGEGNKDDYKAAHGAKSQMMYVAAAICEFEDGTFEFNRHQLEMLPEPINAAQHEASPHSLGILQNFHVRRLKLLDGGKVTIHADIKRTLLSPGVDDIVVPLEVNLNECVGELVKARLTLLRKVHIQAKHETTDDEVEEVAASKWVEKSIHAKSVGAVRIELEVPKNLTPSLHLIGTTIFYEAQIELVMKGCEDIKYAFPVTIAPTEIDKTNSSHRFSANLHVVPHDKKQYVETVCFKPRRPGSGLRKSPVPQH